MDQISFFDECLDWRFDNECYINKYYVIAKLWNGFRAYFSHFRYMINDWDHKEVGLFKSLKEAKAACQADFDQFGEQYKSVYYADRLAYFGEERTI